MDTGIPLWNVGLGAALFIAGALIGFLCGRGLRPGRARIGELEGELRRERDRHRDYQEAVAVHFSKSSELFRDLTHQYTSLYSHLATGARDLCADRLPALGRGFDDRALLESRSPQNGEADDRDEAPDETSVKSTSERKEDEAAT